MLVKVAGIKKGGVGWGHKLFCHLSGGVKISGETGGGGRGSQKFW